MIVPTDGRGKRHEQKESDPVVRKGPLTVVKIKQLFFGGTYLLDQVGEETGVTADLKTCFLNQYKQILLHCLLPGTGRPESIISLQEVGGHSQISIMERIFHPNGAPNSFSPFTEEAKKHFFRLQGKRQGEKEYWAYDSTSISSRSKLLRQVKYGKNKDDSHLPQINLALIFGEKSQLPFYYRKIVRNIPDVKTIQELLLELDVLGNEKKTGHRPRILQRR